MTLTGVRIHGKVRSWSLWIQSMGWALSTAFRFIEFLTGYMKTWQSYTCVAGLKIKMDLLLCIVRHNLLQSRVSPSALLEYIIYVYMQNWATIT